MNKVLTLGNIAKELVDGLRIRTKALLRGAFPPLWEKHLARATISSRGEAYLLQHDKEIAQVWRRLLQDLPPAFQPDAIAEMGPGECFVISELLLHMYPSSSISLYDARFPHLTELHHKVLRAIVADENMDPEGQTLTLSRLAGSVHFGSRVSHHQEFFPSELHEDKCAAYYDLIVSNAVMEHVEEIGDCFRRLRNCLSPRGYMLHVVDFSGHNSFQSASRPLDFQLIPAPLYRAMFPLFHRATRITLEDIERSILSNGLEIVGVTPLSVAAESYFADFYKKRPHRLRNYSADKLRVTSVAIVCRPKP
jgi:hypothetical protein